MNNDAYQFRWRQQVDADDQPIGSPVLQYRTRIDIGPEGQFCAYWDYTEWQDVPTVREF